MLQLGEVQPMAVERRREAAGSTAKLERVLGDGIEHGLDVGGRATDNAENFDGRRLLLDQHLLSLERFRQSLLCFRQVLLKLVDPGALALPRFAGDRGLCFDLKLRGLCTPTHQPLLCLSPALKTTQRSMTG